MTLNETELQNIRQSLTYLEGWIKSGKKGWHYNRLMKMPAVSSSSQKQKEMLDLLLDYIGFLKQNQEAFMDTVEKNPGLPGLSEATFKLSLVYFGRIAETLILEFYLEKQFQERGWNLSLELEKEELQTLESIAGNKVKYVRALFDKLFDRTHPIRYQDFFLDGIKEVRQLRGMRI